VMAQLNKLETEKVEKDKQEAFNQRMASFDERFKLNDEDRKVLASQIKDLDEEQFVDFDKTVSVLLSSKAHSDDEPEAPAEDPAPAEAPAEEAPADAPAPEAPAPEAAPAEASASEVKEVLEQAVDNAKDELVNIPASAPAEDPTIFEKYGKAFAMDQFDIDTKY